MIKLAIIGTGNVAFHLAKAFYSSPAVNVEVVLGRSEKALVDFKAFANVVSVDWNILQDVDVILIAVSDTAIEAVSRKIKNTQALVVHTSGSTTLDVLNHHKRIGVFYPLQTFSKSSELNYSDIPFCIEVKLETDLNVLESLAHALNAKKYRIDSKQRAALHLAAVFSNNFSNHILTEAEKLCEERQVPFKLLQPLMEETIQKAFSIGPQAAQTGPAKRSDTVTLNKQLSDLHTKEQKNIYTTLTQAIQDYYER